MCWGRVCAPGSGRGFRAACLGLCPLELCCRPLPPCLLQPAQNAARGPVPARSLPPKCPGLPPAQACPGNSQGPSFSCPLGRGPHSSPGLSHALWPPAQPHQLPPCRLPCRAPAGRSVPHAGCQSHSPNVSGVQPSPGGGATLGHLCSHLAGPVHAQPGEVHGGSSWSWAGPPGCAEGAGVVPSVGVRVLSSVKRTRSCFRILNSRCVRGVTRSSRKAGGQLEGNGGWGVPCSQHA